MDIIAAVGTLLVIVTAVGITAYRHDREVKKTQREINKKEEEK
jgi:hypothetical protein